MEKFSQKRIEIETIIRQFGSSGTLLGHWLLVDAVMARLEGCSAQETLRRTADLHKISTNLVCSRLRGVIGYMERARAERYAGIWGETKTPTPTELIDTVAEEMKAGPPH